MLTRPLEESRLSLTISVILFAALGLMIVNWRSSLALRTAWSNADVLIFLLAVTLLPIALLQQAKRLPTSQRRLFSVFAFCGLAFACMGWIFSAGMVLGMARGWAAQPLLFSTPYGSGRIAAYQVETTPAGAYVALRLQYAVVPGLLVSREFAAIDAPYVEALRVVPPDSLCVKFTKNHADLQSQHGDSAGFQVPIGPLLTLMPRRMIQPGDPADLAHCLG